MTLLEGTLTITLLLLVAWALAILGDHVSQLIRIEDPWPQKADPSRHQAH
jgi:hypothetical protein